MNLIKITVLAILIVLITNSWLFKVITGLDKNYYRYSNQSGIATVIEYREDRIYINKNVLYHTPGDWDPYKSAFPQYSADTTLYRLYKINLLKFWRWEEYLFNWRYRLPYKKWSDIKKNRPADFVRNKRFQAF